nr:uncharacterized protein LOC110132098 isoform X2 [Odocoileus virginianus texanus]
MPFSGDLHLPRLMGEWSPELNVPSPLGKCDYVTQHPDSQAWSPCWSSVKSAHIYHLFPGRDHPAAAARIPAALRPSLVSPQEATGRRLCSPHNCPAGAVKRAALSTSVSEPGMQNSAPDPSRTDSIQQRRTPESVNPGSKDAEQSGQQLFPAEAILQGQDGMSLGDLTAPGQRTASSGPRYHTAGRLPLACHCHQKPVSGAQGFFSSWRG